MFFVNEGGLYIVTAQYDYKASKYVPSHLLSGLSSEISSVECILISRPSTSRCYLSKIKLLNGQKQSFILNQKKSERLAFTKTGNLIYILKDSYSSKGTKEIIYLQDVSKSGSLVGSINFCDENDINIAPKNFSLKINT